MTINQHALNDILRNPIFQILITILVAMLLQMLSRNFIERAVRRTIKATDRYESKVDEKKREDTVIGIFRRTFVTILWFVVVLVVLTILKVNFAALLTGAGLFSVIIGLGAQNTIKDYLAGIYILSENQYRVGDIVALSGGTTSVVGTSGVVEEITLRITKLRDQDGTLNIVRNGEAGIIANRTFKFSNVVIDLSIPYNVEVDKVERLINEVGMKMLDDPEVNKLVIEPIRFLRVDNFTDSGMIIKVIGKVRPSSQFEVGGLFRRQFKAALDDAGITFGIPNRLIETAPERAKVK